MREPARFTCKESLTWRPTFFTLHSEPLWGAGMSFREKSAWISFVSILVVFGIYFAAVGLAMAGRFDYSRTFGLFIQLVIAFVVLEVALHVIVAKRAPLDAKVPADERERLINLRAHRVGGNTLAVGVFLAIFTLHLGADSRELAHAVLLAFAISQLAKYATEIALHRRDA
jgi:hypothetical protein